MIELCCEYLFVRCLWLYVIIMSRTSFSVNPHSIVCLNVKELLAGSRHHIWSLSDGNLIRTHNHLVRKRTLNYLANLAKWLSCLRTKCLWVRITLPSLKLQMWRLLPARSSLTFRQTMECGFILKLVRNMIITYSQMHRTDKYSQHSSIIWPNWLNGWLFVYELIGNRFESRCRHLNLRYSTGFEQAVPWHSAKL